MGNLEMSITLSLGPHRRRLDKGAATNGRSPTSLLQSRKSEKSMLQTHPNLLQLLSHSKTDCKPLETTSSMLMVSSIDTALAHV